MATTTKEGTRKDNEGEFLKIVIDAIGGTPTDKFLECAKNNGIAQFTHDEKGNLTGATLVVQPLSID